MCSDDGAQCWRWSKQPHRVVTGIHGLLGAHKIHKASTLGRPVTREMTERGEIECDVVSRANVSSLVCCVIIGTERDELRVASCVWQFGCVGVVRSGSRTSLHVTGVILGLNNFRKYVILITAYYVAEIPTLSSHTARRTNTQKDRGRS